MVGFLVCWMCFCLILLSWVVSLCFCFPWGNIRICTNWRRFITGKSICQWTGCFCPIIYCGSYWDGVMTRMLLLIPKTRILPVKIGRMSLKTEIGIPTFQLHPVFSVREMIVSGRVRCLVFTFWSSGSRIRLKEIKLLRFCESHWWNVAFAGTCQELRQSKQITRVFHPKNALLILSGGFNFFSLQKPTLGKFRIWIRTYFWDGLKSPN